MTFTKFQKIIAASGVALSLTLSACGEKHGDNPYSAKAIRFNQEELAQIEAMLFLKNGSAQQFISFVIQGIIKNKNSKEPISVSDLIIQGEVLLMPIAKKYAISHSENKIYQENLEDLKLVIKLYRKAYKRTAEEDISVRKIWKEQTLHSKKYDSVNN